MEQLPQNVAMTNKAVAASKYRTPSASFFAEGRRFLDLARIRTARPHTDAHIYASRPRTQPNHRTSRKRLAATSYITNTISKKDATKNVPRRLRFGSASEVVEFSD